jgi:hypothetical protein
MIKKLYSLILIVFVGFSAFAQPSLPPASPTIPAVDVISLFSDSYTNVAGTDWFPNWGQNTVVSDIAILGNNIKVYSNTNYQGVQFAAPINAASMTNLHLDIWTADCNAFDVYLINIPPLTQVEQKVTLTPNNSGWNSFDIALAQYTNIVLSGVGQFKFVAAPAGSNLYIDNIYFWKPANVPTITDFTVPAQVLGAAPFTLTTPTSTSTGAFTYTSSNTSVATIVGDVVTIVGVGTSTITANQAAAGVYGAGSTSAPLVVSYGPPTVAAPTPTVPAANVISLFSNAYANVPVDTWRTGWSSATLADVMVAGNDTKLYTNLDFVGIEFTGANLVDATAMQFYHIDVWTPNATVFRVKLVDFGANGVFGGDDVEHEYVLPGLTQAGWNSYDIPMSAFTGLVNKAHLAQMIFSAVPVGSSTVYVDNVYFYNVPNAPVLSNFSIPAQVVGASPITITPPTSTSTGAFTYTSSNTSVATIIGDVITIVGAGTSTITATQAAAGGFTSGMITTSLVVSVGPPMVAAPTPTVAPATVISLFSNAYINVPVDTWRTSWSSAALTDMQIVGNDTKLYTNLDFVGVEFTGANMIDATAMQFYHIDVWTPNATVFRVKLVDFGANGVFGGDDVEHEYVLPGLTQAGWNSYDIPLSSFTGLVNRAHLAQMIFSALPTGSATVYIDNVYFTSSSPLPVSLVDFTAKASKNVTNITWTTLSELNNKGFVVEKLTDGGNFKQIGIVAGKGTSNLKNEYVFVDNTPNVRLNYYRLKQIDLDGRFTYSQIVSVKFSKNELMSFSFFPNPAKEVLKINVGLVENENATIRLINIYGQSVITKMIKKSLATSIINVDISKIASGIYYLEMRDGENTSVQKVVIN